MKAGAFSYRHRPFGYRRPATIYRAPAAGQQGPELRPQPRSAVAYQELPYRAVAA